MERRAIRAVSIALDELLNDQAYRLAFWRVAAEEINYRRFFDVNDLAAHADGVAGSFRRDASPPARTGRRARGHRLAHRSSRWALLAERLFREAAKSLRGGARNSAARRWSRHLSRGRKDSLRRRNAPANDWPVHGTTGYEFAPPSDGSAGRSIGRAGNHEDLPAFHRSFDAFRSPRLCEEAPGHATRRSRTTSTSSATCSIAFGRRIAGSAISPSMRWIAQFAKRSPVSRFIEPTSRPENR